MKIQLVSLIVNDPLAAHRFYTEIMGFTSRLYQPEAYLAIVASPEEPDGTGLLLEPNQHPVSKAFQQGIYNEGMPVIVFSVPDIQAEYKRLRALGVKFRQPPQQAAWGGWEAVLDDTCGNYVQITQA